MSELKHYGVPGMKWGVRKAVYRSMSRQERKATRKKYLETPEGRIERAASIGTLIGGPLGGIIAGSIASKKIGDISKTTLDNGKSIVERYQTQPLKTESKRVADLKSSITGKKENGKPAFLMNEQERADFSAAYEQRKKALVNQYKKATTTATKQRIREQSDRLEANYQSIIEQDFWYTDD